MIQQRAVSILRRRHLLEEFCEAVHVPGLDLHKLLQSGRIIRVVRQRMERVANTDVVVRPICTLVYHHERNDASQVASLGERDQIEQ